MKPKPKCEVRTQFCRGTAVMTVKAVGKGAPSTTWRCCMACFAIANRIGKNLEQINEDQTQQPKRKSVRARKPGRA